MKSQTSDILRFIFRTIAVVLTAALPIGVWYMEADPQKVLRQYDGRECFPDPKSKTIGAGINKGLVTLNNLECREAEGYRYNAFIFGASVSCAYEKYGAVSPIPPGVPGPTTWTLLWNLSCRWQKK